MKSLFISTFVFILLILTKLYGLEVNELVAFGDSLTCNGNACLYAENRSTICVLYPQGRFTDGPVWLEVFADKLGLSRPTASLVGGFNFAYGTATTGWKRSYKVLNVGYQIEAYLERVQGQADPRSLFILWAGGNDIKNKIIPITLISNLKKHITTLANAGAKTFLIPNFPPLAKTPIASGTLSFVGLVLGKIGTYFDLVDDPELVHQGFTSFVDKTADFGIQTLNRMLDSMLRKLERSLKIKIYRLDAYTHFYAVKDNLEGYGLREEDLFIYDGFHPSALVHALIAEEAFNVCNKK